ncbi:2-dehydro-3-deoxygalactonokinase [Xinfangfangia sp. D13-10-4-6]|uniref:2-dehydro-3-deoxygalactonokinase n=1 Tax=Pseudogemmobacter hezensis TaxID=2737662 RepID=UPI00155411A0|nr:2-dehydro-3-deoxygalactonokinase [Pseudogemmobacter hezensis]NPD16004.1 2-dehydro-3-deoxygalactonokinase [Pseudogemmobacter hezensis]
MSGFIAVDWGTSSFRLWLINARGETTASSRGAEGMAQCQQTGFAPVLMTHLAKVNAPGDWPVLICGMAGARSGWAEVPYVPLPAPVSALAAGALRLAQGPVLGRDIRILPGVSNPDPAAPDVMRGEETQLLGLMLLGHQGLICMPGTHCKWASLSGTAITGFQSFMTGELFSLLANQSVLRFVMPEGGHVSPEDPDFLAALDQALADPAILSEALFPIRAAGLLGYSTPVAAQARLSGLLIGAEIARMAPKITGDGVTLLGQEGLGALYHAGLIRAGHQPRLADAETATKAGLLCAAKEIWSL